MPVNSLRKLICTLMLSVVFAASAHAAEEINAEQDQVKKLPRFVSLRSDEVNVRTGPGVRYPIKWVIKRENMPVEIIAEYEDWRKIRDIEQDAGWVHKAMLTGRRTGIIRANGKNIYKDADEKSHLVAKANKGAIVSIKNCDVFCEVKTKEIEGYTKPENLWGVYEGEKFKK